MHIAISSQNRKTVTQHAGKCRAFWVYPVCGRAAGPRHLVELAIEASLHANEGRLPEALAGIDVMITGSMGSGLQQKLARQGVRALVTSEEDPDAAVAAFLENRLPVLPNNFRHACDHHHD